MQLDGQFANERFTQEHAEEGETAMKRPLTVLATRQIIDLHTSCVCPPIPIRTLDWQAIDDNTYDCSYEGEDESGSIWVTGAMGTGRTELDAINALLDELEAQ